MNQSMNAVLPTTLDIKSKVLFVVWARALNKISDQTHKTHNKEIVPFAMAADVLS